MLNFKQLMVRWCSVCLVVAGCFSCGDRTAEQSGRSEVGVDYSKLEQLLADENWREANQETVKLMLVLAEKTNAEVFEENDLENFPCQDLKTLDRLWLDYSDGQYGFTVQQKVWKGVGGKPHTLWDSSIGEAFGNLVYWRRDGRWRDYFELSFDPIETPPGHLPIIDTDRTSWLVFGRGSITHWWIFSRMDTCGT